MNIRARFRHHFFWLLLPLLVASGCFGAKSSDRGRRPEGSEAGPGAAAWWASDAVRCASSSECGAGESCQQGVCQVARCQEDFRSKPPLGAHRYFGRDQELMAITDGVYVEAYDGGEHIDTWYSGDEGRLTDLAVGDLDGRPPLTVVGSRVGTTELALRSGELPSRVDIGLVPEAIATGDVDRDGFDEVVAVSRDGRLAVCDFVPAIDCSHTTIEGRYDDLAVADVDGDGAAEPLLLSRGSDRSTVVGVNLDATSSGDEQTRTWDVEFEVSAFDVGYPLGPSGGVVFVLLEPVAEWDSDAIFEDGNWSAQDKLHLYEPTGRQFLTGHRFVAEEATDVVVGDTNGDGEDEVAVLDDGNHVDVYAWRTGALVKRDELDLPATHQATRLGIGDFDGDSTAVALLEGPELVAGAPVPIAVLVLPPYPAGGVLSRDQRAMVGLGFEEHDLESRDQAVSFSVNAKLAVSGKLGFFRGELAAEVGAMWESTAMQLSWLAVGGGHDLMAEPELFGNDYAGVVLAYGCYHRYRYEAYDPRRLAAGDDATMDVLVPVDGRTQLWSSKRYNAMAAATGQYPVIDIPMRIGDVSSYPREILDLDGHHVPDAARLFTDLDTQTLSVSDVGNVEFSMDSRQIDSMSRARSFSYGAAVSVGVEFDGGFAGVGTDATAGAEWFSSDGYTVSVGEGRSFRGSVPPIVDNPNTPEDEFARNQYRFTPYMYQHRYIDHHGQEAHFLVINYAVSDR